MLPSLGNGVRSEIGNTGIRLGIAHRCGETARGGTVRRMNCSTPHFQPGCAGLCTSEGLTAAHHAYRNRLLARARRIVVDPDLAEDVVQETFLRAWRACASFDPEGGPLLHWLLVITHHTAVDVLKARSRSGQVVSAPQPEPISSADDVDRLLTRAELRRALAALPDNHRRVVTETVFADRSAQDVADELGIPLGTVRSRLHYGLKQLRCELRAA